MVCLKSHLFFLSKLKLHKYIKADCIKGALFAFFLQPSISIAIIILKVIHQSLGLNLIFKDLIYVTAFVTLTLKPLPPNLNLQLIAYLNSGYGITFVNKDLLLKLFLSLKISIIYISLKIRGIGALVKSTLGNQYMSCSDIKST